MLDFPVDIKKVLQSDSLPDYQYLFDVLIQVTSVLDTENTSYRQLASDGETLGGLIEFNDNLPMIVLPDLHARYDFLQNLLTYKIYKKANIPGITKATSVYQALKKGLINVVCVGAENSFGFFAPSESFQACVYLNRTTQRYSEVR